MALKSGLLNGYTIVSPFINLYSLGLLFYVYLSSRILDYLNIINVCAH